MKSIETIFLLMLLPLMGCSNKKQEDNVPSPARQLFNESVASIHDYTKKIKNASDSLTVDSLTDSFEKNITEINFSFPPDTDLELTEEENDSLFKLMYIMRETVEQRLHSFKKKQSEDKLLSDEEKTEDQSNL